MRSAVGLLVLFGALPGWAGSLPGGDGDWVDLTHDLSAESVFWPTAEPFELTVDAEGVTDGGYYYSAYSFRAAEHGGTHLDAPVHFAEGRQSTEQIPLERLIGEAVVLDVSAQAAADRDYLLSVADIDAWEAAHGAIGPGTIVLIRTDFSRFWPDAAAYLGTAERGALGAANLHFPGLGEAAARALVARGVASVGIDTASIDHGPSTRFASHVALMSADIPAFENLTGLGQLPARGAYVVALPTKIRGGSGGPLRIVAWVPQ